MNNDRRPIVTGTFRDYDAADRAYNDFRARGYTDDDIHVMMSDETSKRYHSNPNAAIDEGSKALEGAGAGAAVGGTLGGILGAIVGVGSNVLLPGIGLVAGPLAGALAGAGAGGAAGSLVGALVGAGIPEEHAERYESDIKEGGVVVGVHPRDDDYDYVSSRYNEYGASNVYNSRSTGATVGGSHVGTSSMGGSHLGSSTTGSTTGSTGTPGTTPGVGGGTSAY